MRSLGSRSSHFPLLFQSKACHCAGFAFFLSFPAGFFRCTGQFVAQSAQYFPFFPTSGLRCPSSGRTKGRFSEKPRDNSQKRGAIGENTEAFSRLLRSFSPFPTQTRGVSPVHTELVRGGETSSSGFMQKLRCFLPFSSAGKLSASIFRLRSYTFSSSTLQQTTSTAQIITTIPKSKTQNTHM